MWHMAWSDKETREQMSSNEPKWRLTERVISILEKSISPDSVVEHDVDLPDLTKSSKTRQCDIVIRTGTPPRETITIVEVQDRNSKFDINTFDGICVKMQKVGAQHLICVSRQGFPLSIRKEALKKGPTVRLVTLGELETDEWPVGIVGNCVFFTLRTLVAVSSVRIGAKKGHMPRDPKSSHIGEDKVFRVEGFHERLGFAKLIDIYINHYQRQNKLLLGEGTHSLSVHFPIKDEEIWYVHGDESVPLAALDLDVELEIKSEAVPIRALSYRQIDHPNPLAWLMEAKGCYRNREFELSLTLTPRNDGNYTARLHHVPDEIGTFSIHQVRQ